MFYLGYCSVGAFGLLKRGFVWVTKAWVCQGYYSMWSLELLKSGFLWVTIAFVCLHYYNLRLFGFSKRGLSGSLRRGYVRVILWWFCLG